MDSHWRPTKDGRNTTEALYKLVVDSWGLVVLHMIFSRGVTHPMHNLETGDVFWVAPFRLIEEKREEDGKTIRVIVMIDVSQKYIGKKYRFSSISRPIDLEQFDVGQIRKSKEQSFRVKGELLSFIQRRKNTK